MKVFIYDIQRYSIHDGPGIRTTVFLKGCNLRCVWCENPESILSSPQISYNTERCVGCQSCERGCPHKAIAIGFGYPVDRNRCDACAKCVAACPTNALNRIGMWRDVDDLVAELLLDQAYWSMSGGGVTISGGEASIQAEALRSLLATLRGKGVHTVLQTNGNVPWEDLERIAREVNLFHFDLKGIDNAKHRLNVGVGNERILSNAKRLSLEGYPVVFRVPLVPGYNDSPDDLLRLKDFLEGIEAHAVDVLPYHNLGERKLDLIGVEGGGLSQPSLSWMEAVNKARLLKSNAYVLTVSGEDLLKNTPERNPQPNLQPL